MAINNTLAKTLRKVRQNFEQAQQRFQAAMRSKGATAADNAITRLKQVPGSPKHPIRWTSERQRKAFFASDGFGRGIPTRRSNAIVDAWQSKFIPDRNGGILVLENDNPAAEFVQGFNQQGFHADTGWVTTAEVSDLFFNEGGGSVVEVWNTAADPLQGV